MRHKGFLSSAGDAGASLVRPTARAQVAQYNVAGPSRLPLSSPAPASSPSLPPPPIRTSLSTPAPSASSFFTSSSSYLHRRDTRGNVPSSPHLSFLYPPSCLELVNSSTPKASSQSRASRSKSSLAPTSAVSAAAAAAQQLATTHEDSHHQQHLSNHLEPDFTFFHHRYDPPHYLIDNPRANALLKEDARSQLEEEEVLEQEQASDAHAASVPASDSANASAAPLASLRQASSDIRQLLQSGSVVDPDSFVKRCRRLVLQACQINSKSNGRAARSIAYDTVADCALYLSALGQPIPASSIVRHLFVKLGWNPRAVSDLEPPASQRSAANSARSPNTASALAAAATGPRLVLIAQQLISQLTLAPSTTSPRPTRQFESHQHLDAATSLVAAMHLSQMPRTTASQTALIRAMIASGHTRLAVLTYTAEVRAWWDAHKQAKRPRSFTRRQALLTVEIGKPSSQALREITRALQRLEELLGRVGPDLLSELPLRERQALSAKRLELADSLVDLIRLARGGRLPLPAQANAPEMTWIISACCRFERTVLISQPTAMSSFDTAEKKSLQGAAEVIRYYLREYMQRLPDGKTQSAGDPLIGGDSVIRPALGIAVYNQLIHYALSVLKSPSICKQVFQHMTQLRQPSLEPDAVTFNTILRQATTQRYESLARAVLTTKRAAENPPPRSEEATVERSSKLKGAPEAAIDEPRPIKPIIQQIDAAIAEADSYRLVSLLQYITASGLFLRRYRHEPGHADVKELVMRIYPALNTQRYARRRSRSPHPPSENLRPKANQASRHAILSPHVLTATLNLAAKAGKTGLALRVWRLIKRTSLQSALQSPSIDVARVPWKVPVEAGTVLMQVLASEANRMPKVRTQRVREVRRLNHAQVRRQFARGWNIQSSLQRGRSHDRRLSKGEMGEGLRWRAAQLLARREYAFLVHHWGLAKRLASWRRKRVQAWLSPQPGPELKPHPRMDPDTDNQVPDSRFFDALLGVFGRRPGMVQRSPKHVSRSETLSQLRRGFLQTAQHPPAPSDPPSPSASTSELMTSLLSRIHHNSRGRLTALTPDPFLLRILLDMEALKIAIPVGFRWITAFCSMQPEVLVNEERGRRREEVGSFAPFRGLRVKTVGLVRRRISGARGSVTKKE